MKENDIIEEIFDAILKYGCADLTGFNNPEYSRIAISLKSKGFLVTPHVNISIYEISKTGEEVLQAGGWKSYNLGKVKEKMILDKKTFYEYKIYKFKYYTFWPAFVLGIIGGIYSIVEMVKSYSEKKYKIESSNELHKSHILSEYPKKISDFNSKKNDTVFVKTKRTK